ncbi:MAG: vanomycin resistance protein VanB [Oscillochloris sp.]|nr:vanomycin resistance protein VanB [Oscillochloris sp.]
MSDRAVSIAPHHHRRGRFGNPLEWLIVLLMLGTLLAVAATAAVLFGERELATRIYPNISVRGVAIGGLHFADARAKVEHHYAAFRYNPIVLVYDSHIWQPSAEELGLELMLDEALQQAAVYGRTDTRADNLRTAAAIWEQGVDLPLRITIDQRKLQAYLNRIALAVERPPQNADVYLRGPAVVVNPEAWGVQTLIDETLIDVTAALQNLERAEVALRTRELAPQVRDADVAALAAELHMLLDQPIVLSSSHGSCAEAGCRWEIGPATLAEWISLRRIVGSDGKPTARVIIDQAAIRSLLLPVSGAVREEGTLPLVDWNGGALQIIAPGLPGLGLDADQALALVNSALYRSERTIALPMTSIPPPVTEQNLASLGIVEPVGVGVSSFLNSEQYRITNILAGARRMHGVLIPPGAGFSFNTNLGAVNAENGFVEGLAIVDNRTQKEWGGGLCQVSTTVFRAAFFGGLPITERHEHAFRIGWYEELGEPPGLDAAIFTPYNDVRFVNDTDGWMLMQSSVDLQQQRLTIVLYGAPTNRTVNYDYRILERTPAPDEPVYVDDPKLPAGTMRRSDTARGGLKVEVYRTVRVGDTVIANDTFPTEFRPWPDIFVRGTGQ